jgi:hypothetical protein
MQGTRRVAACVAASLVAAASPAAAQLDPGRLPFTSYRASLLMLRDVPEVATETALLPLTLGQVLAEQRTWQRIAPLVDASPSVVKVQYGNLNPKRHHFIYEWQNEVTRNPERARGDLVDTFIRTDADWSFVTREKEWDSGYDALIDVFMFSRASIEGREARFAAQELVAVYKQYAQAAAARAATRLWIPIRLPDYAYDFNTRSIRFPSQPGGGIELMASTDNPIFQWVLPPAARSTANYTLFGVVGSADRSPDPPMTKPGISQGESSPTHNWRSQFAIGASGAGEGGALPNVELLALDRQLRLASIPIDPAVAERLAKADYYATTGRMTGLTARVSIDADRVELGERTIERTRPAKYGVLFARVQKVEILDPKGAVLVSFTPDRLPAPSPPAVETTAAPPPKAPGPSTALKERQAREAQRIKEQNQRIDEITAELRKKALAAQAAARAAQAAAQAQAASPACGDGTASPPTQAAVKVEFVNVAAAPRKLHWVNFGGARQLYGVLQPGQREVVQTYVGHRWIITDTSDACTAAVAIAKESSRIDIR